VQVTISVRHGVLSEEAQAKILGKVERLNRLFDRLLGIEVTVDLERRDEPIVDLSVSAEHKHDFTASQRSSDLMGAVDQVVHKLEQQLRKYKQKIQEHHRTP
jgi:putative sigma-54 modulation protein